MSYHKYAVGQLCVIVFCPSAPEWFGRQCTILEIGCHGYVSNDGFDVSNHDYIIDVQGHNQKVSVKEKCLRPIKPGDLPDFAQEEESLVEEVPA